MKKSLACFLFFFWINHLIDCQELLPSEPFFQDGKKCLLLKVLLQRTYQKGNHLFHLFWRNCKCSIFSRDFKPHIISTTLGLFKQIYAWPKGYEIFELLPIVRRCFLLLTIYLFPPSSVWIKLSSFESYSWCCATYIGPKAGESGTR